MRDTTEGPMSKAMTDAFEGLKCWALHIEGRDDVIAAPSKSLAAFAAYVMNRWFCERAAPDFPTMRAVVVEWDHGYETWKAGSEQFAAEWADWIKANDATPVL